MLQKREIHAMMLEPLIPQYLDLGEPLVTCGYVSYLLGMSTQALRNACLRGEYDDAGVVFVGAHGIMFDPIKFKAWRDAGGERKLRQPSGKLQPSSKKFIIQCHGHRPHAGGPARNDRSRRDPDRDLAKLVKPDIGVRPFDSMETEPDLEHVPAGRYLPSGAA
jgi:hypothetical protein